MIVRKCPPLDHLDRMTDSTGLIQHAIYSIPRRESGYTTDDNARAAAARAEPAVDEICGDHHHGGVKRARDRVRVRAVGEGAGLRHERQAGLRRDA